MTADIQDFRQTLDAAPLGRIQIVAIALCIMLNALDGFDVLAISFAAPGIASEWGVNRAALGLVLSMELIGMAGGSILLGTVADRIGRRPTIIACLTVMAAGMLGAAFASGLVMLSAIRLVTGFGIGGMLSCTNAMVAELANTRSRALAIGLMTAGYPAGAILGGSFASLLLQAGDWRDVFLFGAAITGVMLPLVILLLPESLAFLAQKQPPNALGRINGLLARMGRETIDALPLIHADAPKPSFSTLFSPAFAHITILLIAGYFCHIMTFYFILKWVPKIVVDMGFSPASAGSVLVWANIGGLVGALTFSLLSLRIGARTLVVGAMFLSTIMVTLFGQVQADLLILSIVAAIAGGCTNAGVVGLYALMAQSFPTAIRAGGTGIVIGFGRGGAALGPVIAGYLFSLNCGLPVVAAAMATGSLVAAIISIQLRPFARSSVAA